MERSKLQIVNKRVYSLLTDDHYNWPLAKNTMVLVNAPNTDYSGSPPVLRSRYDLVENPEAKYDKEIAYKVITIYS